MSKRESRKGGTGELGPLIGRRRDLPRPWMARFIAALRNTANVRAACQAAGITRGGAYCARRRWKTFEAAWDEALEEALDGLEAIAWKRAQESSDKLLTFILTSRRPEVYGQRVRHMHDGEVKLKLVEEVVVAGAEDQAESEAEGV